MKSELVLKESNDVRFFVSSKIDKLNGVKHFFSTKLGGVSSGHYESLNLGVYTNDLRENVNINFEKVFSEASMDLQKIVYLNQIHSDKFHLVDEENFHEIIGKDGDALITRTRGIALGVFTADCVPIILTDRSCSFIAVIHAGWKGTKEIIAGKVLKYIISEMRVSPVDILAAVGPSICKNCFEVKEDVAFKFKHRKNDNEIWFVDLWQENIDQLLESGVLPDNIDCGDLCTKCNEELFYSYRRDDGKTGRLGTFIQLEK